MYTIHLRIIVNDDARATKRCLTHAMMVYDTAIPPGPATDRDVSRAHHAILPSCNIY